MRQSSILVALLLAAPLPAQQPAHFDFTIKNIMRGPEVYGREPSRVQWSDDSRWIYFRWLPPGSDWRAELQPYRVRATPGATPQRITDAQMDSAGPLLARGSLSPDGRSRAVSYNGDLYLVDLRHDTSRRLSETRAAERDPQFGAQGTHIYFIRDDNVYSLALDGGLVHQLTDIRQGPAPKVAAHPKGQRGALEAEQSQLFQVIRDKMRADSITKAERAERDSLWAKPLYLLKNERVASLAVSPNGKALLLVTSIRPDDARATEVPQYVTESGYTEDMRGRTKVGDAQARGRVAYMRLPSGDVRWLHVIPGDSARPPAQVQMLGWNDAGSTALLFAVSRNYKTRYLETVDADSGRLTSVDVLRDTAWVGGPCFGCGGWYDGGKRFWYVSEADGWAHLYTRAADGSDEQQLTRGQWEVQDVALSPDKRWFYLHTSEVSPFERQFYRMSVSGGARERITTRKGGHTVTVSPNGRLLADIYSSVNRPPDLFVMRNSPGATMAQLTTSPTKAWLSVPWIVPDIVMVPASDGVQVPAHIYRPSDMHATPNGAAVIFVHGAGYLQNVMDYWSSSYPREYMFNQFLASKGYVVLDMDYRGSAGHGRDWRTAIYRHMGGRDLQDEVDGSHYLTKTLGIPPERVGIYGGSYGGFMTLMALFTAPKYFGAGAALRSVTDWADYNHWYTSRILNLPQDDSVAYRQSSPIYFAQGLEDPLLMAHGMVDTNVHFQDIVRLTQRLIELGKTNWQLAVYPVESHGFVRPSSWTDEYRRIFTLFQTTIGQSRGATKAAGRLGGR
ncbi:MAG TPA: prolyl oligopeptidase family serine peptidase [Gemmatimonadaceae bacterium]|nr:prolyl oligopeptidase family serine peptidase [Gemmatimonadaceae bacterium]